MTTTKLPEAILDQGPDIEGLNLLVSNLEQALTAVYGKRVGFVLLTTPFGVNTSAYYIGNVQKVDSLHLLRQVADGIEQELGEAAKAHH